MVARLFHFLTHSERRKLFGLLPWVVGSALAEVVGIAAVIPFFSVLADPESLLVIPVIGDWFASRDNYDTIALLRWFGIGVAMTIVATNVTVILTNWRLLHFGWDLNFRISSRLLEHYLIQPYEFILRNNSATLINKVIQEVRRITQDGIISALDLVAKAFVTLAIVVFLFFLNPLLAVVAFATLTGLYAIIFAATRRYIRRIGREATELNSARLRVATEAIAGFKSIKVAGTESQALERFKIPARRFAEVQAASQAVASLPRFALEAVAVGGMVLITSLLAGRAGSFTETLPLLGAYAFAGLRLMPALQSLFSSLTKLRFSIGAFEAIEADLHAVAEHERIALSEVLPQRSHRFCTAIHLEHITFSYPDTESPSIADINLTIPKNTSLAIVGQTGSGKSTLADIILGLLEPSAGRILVDGKEIFKSDLRSYRQLFGYVPQDIFLTDGTILENVAFGIPRDMIDINRVEQACEAAQLAHFIRNDLPGSYSAIIGERGVRLSGGQRQRIGIARALYHDPPILVFDEATSALDIHTEEAVYNALNIIAETRTVITIAHRLETVSKADMVVLLKSGRITKQGDAASMLNYYKAGTI